MPVISYIDAVTMAMREEMERDSRVFVLGEDVGKKAGSLKPLMVYTTNSVKTGSSIPARRICNRRSWDWSRHVWASADS